MGIDGNLHASAPLEVGSMRFVRRSGAVQRPERGLVAYSASLCALALLAFGLFVIEGMRFGNPWILGCLALVAVVAERASLRLNDTTEISISLLPTLFAGVLFGPLAALIVGAASNLLDIGGGGDAPLLKWMTYTATRALTGAAAGAAALVTLHAPIGKVGSTVAATAAAALTAETLDISFAALTSAVKGLGRPMAVIKATAPFALASVPLYAPLVALLVISYQDVSAWTLPLFLAPTLAAQRLYALYQGQRQLTGDLLDVNARLERANLSFATALVATLDARDHYTAGHSAAVAVYARDIAARMGLSGHGQQLVHLCGLVHDIGKIGLPAGLLEKPGALTLEERRQMERHTVIGETILANVEDYAEIAAVVRHHHERVDGHGYPDKLEGTEIPLLSRIIAVADAYNAMTSDRAYRDAMPSRVARMRLAQAVESQFDTSVVAAFEALLAAAPEAYRSGSQAHFRFVTESSMHPGTLVEAPPERATATA
jgi:HD-GYP domain-containing protein (c-di-GMP phosphodiesterase class II)